MIDYAALLRPRSRHRSLGYLTALVIMFGAMALGYKALLLYTNAVALISHNDGLRTKQTQVRSQPSHKDLEAQRQLAVLLKERTFPWANVFRAIEHATGTDIELLEFRPDRRQGTLVLKGEGLNAESVIRYLELLQEDPTFSRVYLVHTASEQHGRLLTRSFEIRLNLNGKWLVKHP